MRRSVICSLLGLIITINSCSRKTASIQLLHSAEINFPSASAIEFFNDRLYVFGDDARTMLILSPTYSVIDSVFITERGSHRINKDEKHDIESAMISNDNGKPLLFGVGSMSANKRWSVVEYDLTTGSVDHTQFFDTLKKFTGIDALNIEGSCIMEPIIVFSNRANLSQPLNHLIFWNKRDSIGLKQLQLPRSQKLAGVSGLCYVKEQDILLFTASEEETKNAIDDGVIGDSYLGLIENFSSRAKQENLQPDMFIKLSDIDKVFLKQKIESICVEKITDGEMISHLVADNDNGFSRIFKLSINLAQLKQ